MLAKHGLGLNLVRLLTFHRMKQFQYCSPACFPHPPLTEVMYCAPPANPTQL